MSASTERTQLVEAELLAIEGPQSARSKSTWWLPAWSKPAKAVFGTGEGARWAISELRS